ncbi:MAG TPA: carboxypeptidase-like regulatory domain-containing protein [Bryobacteraceae bacterium]|nr:carboxypeptidase-like regulatory domain-containing protein [Bryobacteraceae bacterium]
MRLVKVLALAALVAAGLYAQEFRGTISGGVTDPQGAAIPKATVTATEVQTGTKTTATSESTGQYTLSFLPPGLYTITAEAAGFKRAVRQGIRLSAGEHPVIDIRLDVGAVSESVTVDAEAPLVTASNATVGQTVTTKEVEDLPVNGRAPIMLMTLAMGVLQTSEPGPIRPFDLPGGGFVVGGIGGSNEFLLDGAPNTNSSTGAASAYSPPQDAVQEVRVSAFESDAAYGHAGGGTANLITKSGTNSLHGSAYEFNQTSNLDANSFFGNKSGSPRPAYHYNQFGVTSGGPLWIPKVFNGKNRVFWFFGYEGLRDSDPATSPLETGSPAYFVTVPTAAERQGDFSALLKLNAGTKDYTIYDPSTGAASGTQVARTPFPNNVIPSNRLNAVAQNYLQFFPQPNAPGFSDGFQNFVVNAVDSDGYDNELGRLDFNLSDKNKLTFDARHSNRTQNKNNIFGNSATGNFLYRINQGITLDDVYTLTPTMVMDVRGNWTRFIQQHTSPADEIDPSSLGFPSYIDGNSQAPTIPFITFSSCGAAAGASPSFQCLGYASDDHSSNDIYQIFGDVVKVRGNHTIKVGADIREYRLNSFTNGNSAGTYTFGYSTENFSPSATQIAQSWTNGPLNNATPSPFGQDFAAFLLGLPSTGSFDLNSHASASSQYYGLFIQDDWRARSNLTFNLGLRWEHETPTTERYDRAVNGFDPTAANPIASAAAAAYAANPIPQLSASQFSALGGLTFVGANSPSIYKSQSKIFSPRFGFAWTPPVLDRKTVVRGGFGVFVEPLGITGLNQSGFSQTTQFVATNDNYISPAASLSDPFPGGIFQPSGASKGTGTFLGQGITFYNPNSLDPYSLRWDFGIQRQLPGNLVLEVAYIGNHAIHLPGSVQLDYVPQQFLSTSPVRDATTVTLLTGSVTNPFKGLLPNSSSLNGSSVQRQQLLVPFPQYPVGSGTSNGIVEQGANAFSSIYNSLNVRLQARLTHGLTMINNFVWSSLIERVSYLNDGDPAPEKRISSISRPLREVLAASYELPVGRGRPLNISNRFINAVFGGWALNGTLTLETGPPLSWGNVIYYGGPLNLQEHQPDGKAFDTTQFNTVSSQQLANNIRTFDTMYGNLRRDPTKNLDASILKSFPFGERKYFQFRFETFNTTNRVTFGSPNLTPTSSAFGLIQTQANTPRRLQLGARLVW